jgi:hypothetical protein
VIDIKEILEQELELGEQVIPMVAPDLIRSLNPNTEKGINKQLL